MTAETAQAGRMMVLGLGNLLNSDEGFGVHVLRALQAEVAVRHPRVDFVDGGTLGLNLLPMVEEASHLLLVDCVDAGAPPGAIVELGGEEIPLYSGVKVSLHQTTFQEVLGLAQIRDSLPPILYLIGVQPVSLAIGTELSSPVRARLPQVAARVEELITHWEET